jgi:PKD repeat protein
MQFLPGKNSKLLSLLSFILLLASCSYDMKDIGPKATASFTVAPVSGRTNTYLLTSTSQNAFLFDWDKGSGYVRSKTTDTVYFPTKGNYTIKLLAYGPGGVDSAAQTINVTASDPASIAVASFTMTPITGQANKYLLTSTSLYASALEWDKADGKGFVKGALTDTAYFPLKGSYTIRLRATGLTNTSIATQAVNVAADDPAFVTTFKLLTSHGWKLDPGATANAIIVGTENNPAEYYAGGPLATCQVDDIYTFNANNTLTYNANGQTFNAGNVAPNYVCSNDRSYSNVAFTYSETVAAGRAGIATITLSGAPPTNFIGVTDVPVENVYRIISISSTSLVLRAGNGSGTVDQFKMIPQ